jgi:hypothetical protein
MKSYNNSVMIDGRNIALPHATKKKYKMPKKAVSIIYTMLT